MAAAEGVYTGQYMYAGKTAPLFVGNILPVGKMPEGMIFIIHSSLHLITKHQL